MRIFLHCWEFVLRHFRKLPLCILPKKKSKYHGQERVRKENFSCCVSLIAIRSLSLSLSINILLSGVVIIHVYIFLPHNSLCEMYIFWSSQIFNQQAKPTLLWQLFFSSVDGQVIYKLLVEHLWIRFSDFFGLGLNNVKYHFKKLTPSPVSFPSFGHVTILHLLSWLPLV